MRPAFLRSTLAAALLAVVALHALAPEAEGGPRKRRAAKWLAVRKFRPRHGRTFVPLDAEVKVRFSRPLDPATVTTSTVKFHELSGGAVGWIFRLERDGRELVLTPTLPLEPGTDHEVEIRPGLRSTDGLTLRFEKHAIFFTDSRHQTFDLIRQDQFEVLDDRMAEGRGAHSATRIGTRVLLAGGYYDYSNLARTADVFEPVGNTFTVAATQLMAPRAYHPAVDLGSGRAMLIGGFDNVLAMRSTEVFTYATRAFVAGPNLLEPRDGHAAVTLRDGRVLATGGVEWVPQAPPANALAFYSTTAEIWDPVTNAFRATTGAPIARRYGHTLTLLPDGRVLVVGGLRPTAPYSAEIFDPATETFTPTTAPPSQHRAFHAATVLDAEGRVLLSDGGNAILEIFDPATGRFTRTGGASFAFRTSATASLLPGGNVLLAGGLDDRLNPPVALSAMDLYVPDAGLYGRVYRPYTAFPEGRYGHTATTLADGRVLFAGGFGIASSDSLDTAVIFTPDPPE